MIGLWKHVWKSLPTLSAAAFILAGGFWLTDTVLLGLELFVGVSNPEPVGIKLAAVLASVVGLLGLYSPLAGHVPRVALAGAILLAAPGVVWSLLLAWGISGAISTSIPTPPVVVVTVAFIPIVFGFLLYSSASLYTDVPSRVVGLLLLAHITILFAAVPATGLLQFGLVGMLSGTLVTTGVYLRCEFTSTNLPTPSDESVVW